MTHFLTQGFPALILIFSIITDFYFFFFLKSVTYISGEKSSNHRRTDTRQETSNWIIAQLGIQISCVDPLNNTHDTGREAVLKLHSDFHISPFKFMYKIRNNSTTKEFLHVKASPKVTFQRRLEAPLDYSMLLHLAASSLGMFSLSKGLLPCTCTFLELVFSF